MPPKTITIRIEEEDNRLPFNAFFDAVAGTVSILKDIDSEMSTEKKQSLEWDISSVSMHSPLEFTLEAIPYDESMRRDPITPFLDDVNRLERGEKAHFLNQKQQNRLKKIVGALDKGIRSITFNSNGNAAKVSRVIVDTIMDYSVKKSDHYEIGSIEGRLEVISVHGKDSIKVWDRRFNDEVTCTLSDEKLEEAKRALGKRVKIRGRIKYHKKHPKYVVDVFDIRVLREIKELPQPDKIGPIDLFGDEEPADILRGIENGN